MNEYLYQHSKPTCISERTYKVDFVTKFPLAISDHAMAGTVTVKNTIYGKLVSNCYASYVKTSSESRLYVVPKPSVCELDLFNACGNKSCSFIHFDPSKFAPESFFDFTQDHRCESCGDMVLESERYFGSIDHCDHVFCHDCIE